MIDTRWIGLHGIGRFASEIIPRLGEYEPLPRGLSLLHPLDPLWLSIILKKLSPDLYFSPGFNPPLIDFAPTVFTVHDLIHLKVSSENNTSKNLYYKYVVLPALKRTATVLTVSEYSKSELVEWSGISPGKVVVVGNGVGPEYSPYGDKHSPGYPYLFYIGNRKPHKNIPRLLKAFASSGVSRDMRLLMSGHPDEETSRLINSLGLNGAVEFAGVIPDARLPEYYRGAAALVFPSLYEGFGLPPLEAMASGLPVVTSNGTSLPEVVGDAAVLVDPEDVESIADGIRRVVQDEGLRRELTLRGIERSRSFTWDSCARTVREVLGKIACSRSS